MIDNVIDWAAEQVYPCDVCHKPPEDCTCPECDVCGVAGDPACINTHMPFKKWWPSLGMKNKTETERMVENVIKVLRFMTGGQGHAGISIFDAGAGGGFSVGQVQVFLERDGETLDKMVHSPQELKELILMCIYHNFDDPQVVDKMLKTRAWDK